MVLDPVAPKPALEDLIVNSPDSRSKDYLKGKLEARLQYSGAQFTPSFNLEELRDAQRKDQSWIKLNFRWHKYIYYFF